MFKDVPIQVWLLLAIAATGYAPARYLLRYNASSPSKRDITQPPEDLSWRTSDKLYQSLGIVVGLAALSIFIFTRTAAAFAQSPTFWPLLIAGIGAWALVSVLKGFRTGQIMPFVRGVNRTYERQAQPRRFWASMSWNGLLGSLLLGGGGFGIAELPKQALRDQCYDEKNSHSAQQQLAGCNRLISGSEHRPDAAQWLALRGTAYYRLKDYQRAQDDYIEAVRLNPKDAASFYNLALVDEQRGNAAKAINDYTAAIAVRPDDADTFAGRGYDLMQTGRFTEAASDFTRASELKPSDLTSIANRGMSYALGGDRGRAEQDFATVRRSDPSNSVLLQNEVLLSYKAGDLRSLVDNLSALLKDNPNNVMALRMRADLYSRLGEMEKYYDDKDALWRLSRASTVATRSP